LISEGGKVSAGGPTERVSVEKTGRNRRMNRPYIVKEEEVTRLTYAYQQMTKYTYQKRTPPEMLKDGASRQRADHLFWSKTRTRLHGRVRKKLLHAVEKSKRETHPAPIAWKNDSSIGKNFEVRRKRLGEYSRAEKKEEKQRKKLLSKKLSILKTGKEMGEDIVE